jgi:hypothetical protein
MEFLLTNLLGSFPLPLSKDSSMDDSQPIIVDLSILQCDVPPLIDVPSIETTSTQLLNLMGSLHGAYMAVHFAYLALPVP